MKCQHIKKGIKGFVSVSIFDRFWENVEIPPNENDCWIWTGLKSKKGYGSISLIGKKMMRAHRLSWELYNKREIPYWLLACHVCDNPSCVNPNHIFIGTHKDNARDSMKKGRFFATRKQPSGHCSLGHEPTISNTYTYPSGRKECRICRANRHGMLRGFNGNPVLSAAALLEEGE
jgi:hypothetical protein